MPKTKTDLSALKKSWIKRVTGGDKHFRIEDNRIYCKPCSKLFNWKQFSQIQQHVAVEVHRKNAVRFDAKPERQLLLSDAPSQSNKFFEDICEAFIAADIPLVKLENPKLLNCLETYTKKSIPHRTTLGKNYLPKVYAKTMDEIRNNIGNQHIWLTVDETTDKAGRYIACVMVGALNKDKPIKSYLLMCRQLEKTNNATITQLVLDALPLLWPGVSQKNIEEKFLLFVTDSVSYMKKAGKNLKSTYPSLFHVTCLAHCFNLVAEEVRGHYEEVDRFIGAMKAIYKKSPSRVLKYKAAFPELPLPPSPIYVRWGTWLEAAEFYAENFESIKEIVESLNSQEAKAIETAQTMIKHSNLQTDLAYLSANFTFLSKTLKELQEPMMPLSEYFRITDSASKILKSAKGPVGKAVYEKLKQTLDKNSDLKIVKQISNIIDGDSENTEVTLQPSKIAAFKYATLTSVDVERSFSMEKALSGDRRQSMSIENLEMSLVIHHLSVNERV